MSENQGHQATTEGINPLDGEVVLQNVHPSWINWKWRFIFGIFLMVIGVEVGGDAAAAFMFMGLGCFLSAYLARRASRYIVTNQRVKTKVGLLGSSTHEARLSNLNGISTSSGIIEGLFGKGTVSVTDAAREELYIRGVGNYEELARTLREQHQSASQPGRHGNQRPAQGHNQGAQPQRGHQQNPSAQNHGQQSATGPQQDAQPAGGKQQSATSSTADDTDDSIKKQCIDCNELVDGDVEFCPNCGTEDPFTPTPDPEQGSDNRGQTTEGIETTSESPLEVEQREHPVTSVAESVLTTHRPRSGVADELCQVLVDPDADKQRLEDALTEAVDTIETSAAVTDTIDRIANPTDRGQIESAHSSIRNESGELPNALEPVLNGTLTVHDDLEECETEYGRLEDAAVELCETVEREQDTRVPGGDITSRTGQASEAIESMTETTSQSSEPALSSVVDDVERSARPTTDRTRTLLETLRESDDDGEIASVLRSAVEDLDEYAELHAPLADIGHRDVRRRLTSLDDELQREEGAIYRHLADRIRELDTMVERDDIDSVQLYAIYQECTFYDRTLLPRLSRSDSGSGSTDVSRQLRNVEDRRTAIENDYVTVRADHNHTIPNHFLSLVSSLCDRARDLDENQSERAAGILKAADELLDGVEQLYERNEYSVMLRRLRG